MPLTRPADTLSPRGEGKVRNCEADELTTNVPSKEFPTSDKV